MQGVYRAKNHRKYLENHLKSHRFLPQKTVRVVEQLVQVGLLLHRVINGITVNSRGCRKIDGPFDQNSSKKEL